MFGYKSKQELKKKNTNTNTQKEIPFHPMQVENILYTSDRIMNSKTQTVFVKFKMFFLLSTFLFQPSDQWTRPECMMATNPTHLGRRCTCLQ